MREMSSFSFGEAYGPLGVFAPRRLPSAPRDVANPAMTSFTPVHHEADWMVPGKTPAWQSPFFALR